MANLINPTPFKERGYVYRKPSKKECQEMGWHHYYLTRDIVKDFEHVKGAAQWIKDTIWWQDYVLLPFGEVYFKYERDAVMFALKWA